MLMVVLNTASWNMLPS